MNLRIRKEIFFYELFFLDKGFIVTRMWWGPGGEGGV